MLETALYAGSSVIGLVAYLLLLVSSGESLTLSQGGTDMAGLHTLLRCRRIQVRALGRPTPTDRDALLHLMATTTPPEAMGGQGQTIWTLP